MATILIQLGYMIGISQSVLHPAKSLEYLGFIIDTEKQAFLIPGRKVESFGKLREDILRHKKSVDVKCLQRLQGKCVSLSLAVLMAKLYIRSISAAIALADGDSRVKLSDRVRDEIKHWCFLNTWSGFLPWSNEKHVILCTTRERVKIVMKMSAENSRSFAMVLRI